MKGDSCKGLRVKGVLVGDAVLVLDDEEARSLYACGYYGQPLEVEKPRGADFEGPLRLSAIEAYYLYEKGVLEVRFRSGEEAGNALKEVIKSNPRFTKLYRVYKDLREKGFVVRTGLKFGADFAVYRLGPGIEHAPFIIHTYEYDTKFDPVELIRAGRLGHSVRKRFLLASVEPTGEPVYLMVDWFRP